MTYEQGEACHIWGNYCNKEEIHEAIYEVFDAPLRLPEELLIIKEIFL